MLNSRLSISSAVGLYRLYILIYIYIYIIYIYIYIPRRTIWLFFIEYTGNTKYNGQNNSFEEDSLEDLFSE